MNGRKLFLSAVLLVCVCLPGVAFAQGEDEGPGVTLWPLEIYGCEFREGQGWAELRDVTAKWNAWMDEGGQNDYWAYLLAPHYRSQQLTFDVLWVGGWASGATMATSLEHWVTGGGELNAEFGRVVDCTAVVNFATLELATPNEPQDAGPVEFSDCVVAEGREFSEAFAAVQAWIAYQVEQGIEENHFMLFPAYGESSDSEYDFKWVSSSSWATLGASYDQFGTGGGWRKANELFDGLLECDSSRLYQATRVRSMQMGE